MEIYIDHDYKCHITNDGTMRAVEIAEFDGKAQMWIEGMRYIPPEEVWTRPDGIKINGESISPWIDSALLEKFQAQYEAQLAAAAAAYTEGVNAAYDDN